MLVKIVRKGFFLTALCVTGNIILCGISTPSYATTQATERPQDSLLRVGDTIEVNVKGEKELSNSFIIDKAGTITMPLIGKVFVAGKTPHEASEIITRKLKDGYLHHPDVIIANQNHEKIKNNDDKPNAANSKKIRVPASPANKDTKQKKTENRQNTNIIDLVQKKAEKRIEPEQKDTKKPKHTEKTLKDPKHIYVLGAVNNPGYYTLPPTAGHVLNAVALAGGYTQNAQTRTFEIIREIKGVYYRQHAQIGALEYQDGDVIIIGQR
ncbi:MAG: polysaccharide biosynthesis/export family protein [Alphaproteobacteria bacterium]